MGFVFYETNTRAEKEIYETNTRAEKEISPLRKRYQLTSKSRQPLKQLGLRIKEEEEDTKKKKNKNHG